MDIKQVLQMVLDRGASDLHLTVGQPPILRINGELIPIRGECLKPADTERYMKAVISDGQFEKIQSVGGADFGFGYDNKARFRVNVYRQKGVYGLALRLLPSEILSLEEIGFPAAIRDLLFRPRGLILVTGPTGSGKTTTLASMVEVINSEIGGHILLFEDPIEYEHKHKKGIITQREIGVDVPDFTYAIRSGLRQDPDVMLIGEMRDRDTMEAAITAAETGHLVFATLHTTGAPKTVDRIIGAFPTTHQSQIRAQLATSILAIISQVLIPRADQPGRVAAFEIMVTTPSIQSHIRENKGFQITSDIQTGAKYGMITLDASLLHLYETGIISYGDLLSKCQDPDTILQKVKV